MELPPLTSCGPSVCGGPWAGLASCWPLPQPRLPVSAAGGGRLRCTLAISAEIIFLNLQFRQACGPAGTVFSREESLRTIAFAKLRLIRCVTAADATTRYDPFCENVFGAARGCATMKAPVGLSSGRAVCVSRWRGLNPDKLRRTCNGDDRRLWRKQGGAVGAAASRMQGPLKGRGRRWEPQPVQTPI